MYNLPGCGPWECRARNLDIINFHNYSLDCERLHGAVKESKFGSQQFRSAFVCSLYNFGFFFSLKYPASQ